MNNRDDFDALHKSLVEGAMQHPDYAKNKVSAIHGYSEGVEHALDTVRTKGYSKPRTIETVEELDKLPFESVVRDAEGHVLERWSMPEENVWTTVMVNRFIPPGDIALPATVLYEPGTGQ